MMEELDDTLERELNNFGKLLKEKLDNGSLPSHVVDIAEKIVEKGVDDAVVDYNDFIYFNVLLQVLQSSKHNISSEELKQLAEENKQ